MSKQINELTGIEHYIGTGHEIIFIAEKVNELVRQVNELTEEVNLLKQRLDGEADE